MGLIRITRKAESRCECCGAELQQTPRRADAHGHVFNPLCAACGTVQTWARPLPEPPPTFRVG